MKSIMDVVVVTAHSESGDDYGPWVFDQKLSSRQLEQFLREMAEGDFPEEGEEDGPGDFGSYLFVTISETTVIKKSSLRTK